MTAEFETVQRSAAMLAEAVLGRRVRLEVDDRAPASGRRPLTGVDRTAELVIVLPTVVTAFGDDELADQLSARLTGADRQRQTYEKEGLAGVLDLLGSEFLRGC